MYKCKMTIPRDVLQAQRNAPALARVEIGTRIQREVVPQVEREAQALLGADPGKVQYPFAFATARSRRYYFARFKGRIPYQRTGQIEKGWRVGLDRRLGEGQLSIYNAMPAAGWVYGPGNAGGDYRQVPGHRNTGWGKNLAFDLALVQSLIVDLLVEVWYQATMEALS